MNEIKKMRILFECKKYVIYFIIFGFISILIFCSRNAPPKSIEVNEDTIKFTLKDDNYTRVNFSYNTENIWRTIPMENHDTNWVAVIFNPQKTILYKFLINNETWITDPLNPNLNKEGEDNDYYSFIRKL